jgi:isopentenyl-diphosphate delta-isomerase
MSAREMSLVELVDTGGQPVGATTVSHAHTWPGVLHRAFSVLLFDDDGRVLLQRRAAAKTRFALRWGNTCCGHPGPAENLRTAAARRVDEELGVRAVGLTPVGVYVYRAGDPATGRVEHEYDHVVVGRIAADVPLRPDPAEIAELRWVHVPELYQDLEERPADYAPWLGGVLAAWHDHVGTVDAEPSGGR